MYTPFFELLSPQFTFLVGDDKTSVSVHSAVMASLSEPFDRLVNGPMREAQEKCAEISDIDLKTFLLLVEFAYTHNYTVRSCLEDSIKNYMANSELAEDSEWELHDGKYIVDLCQPSEKALTNASLETHWRERQYKSASREYCEKHARSVECALHLPISKNEAIYMVHAKLYSLGERYITPQLKVVAMQKLHIVLGSCLCMGCLNRVGQDEQISAVISLVSYAYNNDNTPDRGADGHLDLLRQEVLEFAVISMVHLQDHPSFTELVASNEQLAMDIIRLMQRLRNDGKNHAEADDEEDDEGEDADDDEEDE